MAESIKFEEVLELFESNGWVLQRIFGNFRVFREPKEDFYWTIPVNDGKVNYEIGRQVKEYFTEQE